MWGHFFQFNQRPEISQPSLKSKAPIKKSTLFPPKKRHFLYTCTTWKTKLRMFTHFCFSKNFAKSPKWPPFFWKEVSWPLFWKLRIFHPITQKNNNFPTQKTQHFPTYHPNWKLTIFHPINTKKPFPKKKHINTKSIPKTAFPIWPNWSLRWKIQPHPPKQVAWLFRMTLASALSVTFRQVFFGAFTRKPSHQAVPVPTRVPGLPGCLPKMGI